MGLEKTNLIIFQCFDKISASWLTCFDRVMTALEKLASMPEASVA